MVKSRLDIMTVILALNGRPPLHKIFGLSRQVSLKKILKKRRNIVATTKD